MSGPATCPECGGRKGMRLGEHFLACPVCLGEGQVGGDGEPAAAGAERARRPAWEHPAVQAAGLCGFCFSAGEVLTLTGGPPGRPGLRILPCPRGCPRPRTSQT
ncbi:hypothetical protein [Nonomuraea pusilla]|uniref:hypothetical protein n=1 Tax=Nonomuraea pusilla TaxID=46177 RepID=UPI001160726B|nr:hypothetical protein [Nonomuraea pusilla]